MSHTWVDGAAADAVPADDRGLNYADGAFETLHCNAGKLACPNLHEVRLASALERLGFDGPQILARQCFDEMKQLLAEVAHSGVVRCTVTRGSGPRGYAPGGLCVPRRIIAIDDFPDLDDRPMRCGVARVRWADQPHLAGLKLLARTEQVLAAGEARQQGWDDAVMQDQRGHVVSSSRANLFIFRNGQFLTPNLEACGIAGTRRQLLLDYVLPRLGYGSSTQDLTLDNVMNADAVILTNTLIGVASVGSIEDRMFDRDAAERLLTPLRAALLECVSERSPS